MKKLRNYIAMLLACVCVASMLVACTSEDTQDDTKQTQDVTEETEETVEGYEGEKGKPLTVDFNTHGEITPDAGAIETMALTLAGVTYDLPCAVSKLLDNGWRFYSDEIADQSVSADTETAVMGFNLYYGESEAVTAEIGRLRNASTAKATVRDCVVTKLSITIPENAEDVVSFVLPGGINERSTAADVIEVFGSATDNEAFDFVQTGTTMIFYSEHKTTGASFAFNFNDDGTLTSVMVIL